ncbi:SOS cell division inhibitor [Marinobacter halodurans]|uniref:SOS cell division inhibitor n=1 Tax=Marinobacter halodurans TaxID=2528979 RepID=A0ABY1ZUH7_9GAMM|nr:SOS cell division inhibitor [Marinobacter halodurans]TBW59452.1 SOS cell division inhibitor [Marinobacter halodurans]
MPNALESLDRLINDFREALTREDWETLDRVSQSVRPAVAAAVADVEEGTGDRDGLGQRLERLQTLMDDATRQATESRDTAARELRGMNQNRNALKTYANVRARGRRP